MISTTVFSENYKGQIHLGAGDVGNTEVPLQLEVRDCNFTGNYPLIDALFKVSTNAKLFIYHTLFENNYSMSRGGIILADYQ